MDRALVGRLGTFGAAVVVGAAASAIAPSLPIVIAGTALSGVAGGIFANDLGAMDAQLGDPDLRNAHLTRAVGRAIAVVINEVAQNHQGRSRLALDALAQSARQDWPDIIKDILGHQTPTELFEENLAETYFATAAKDVETLRALANWQDWRPVIHALRPRARRWLRQSWRGRSGGLYPLGTLTPTLVDTLAQKLHKQFPKAIREVLKRDFAQGEEAFAGMVFDLLGNLTAGQQQLAQHLTELRQQTASLSQILADQLTRDLQRLEGIVIKEGETTRKTVLYKSQGKYGDAEPLYLEAVVIFWERLGEEHPNTQTVLNNVIDFYRTALAAGLPDRRLRQHPLGDLIRSRL